MAEEVDGLVSGWRGLSIAVGAKVGRPVGAGKVRYAVESSGLPIGKHVGGSLLFTQGDVEAVARLVGGAR